jgi:hypothetical protein
MEDAVWKVAVAVIGAGILAILGLQFNLAKKSFNEVKRNTLLVSMKHEALMYALDKHLQNGIRSHYSTKLIELMDEHGFVHKKED